MAKKRKLQLKDLALGTASMATLVDLYNRLGPDTPADASTFTTREKAFARIDGLSRADGRDLAKAAYEVGLLDEERYEALKPQSAKEKDPPAKPKKDPPAKVAKPKEKKEKAPEAKEEKKPKGPVIREVAEELLQQVVRQDENGHDEGLPYADILAEVHRQFPGCKTSVACLRWYAVRLREEGKKVPARPRARPVAAGE